MVELQALSPCNGLLPVTIGDAVVSEQQQETLSILAPLATGSVDGVLQAEHGLGWPDMGRITQAGPVRCIWMGRGQAMLVGAAPSEALTQHAAVTDQSDAWTVVRLNGAQAEDVLARLIPLDLRLARFGIGQTARTLCQHLHVSISRIDESCFEIMAFRSMAQTLVHELTEAMRSVEARNN